MLTLLLLLAMGPSETIQAQYKAHVRFLADDLLEGRESTFRGQKLAAAYIAAQLRSAGVQGAYPDSDTPYYQHFDLNVKSVIPESVKLVLNRDGKPVDLVPGEHFSVRSFGEGSMEATGVAFVGYGLQTETLDEWAGVDVKGKWAMIMGVTPDHFEEDEALSKASNPWQRYVAAKKAGAKGIIFLMSEELESKMPHSYEMSLAGVEDTKKKESSRGDTPLMRISRSGWNTLLGDSADRAQKSLDNVSEGGEPDSFLIDGVSLSFETEFKNEVRQTENVMGIIPGSDPKLKNQYVILSAHYDHEGIKDGIVYNGADDNASGTATLLLAAADLAKLPLRRSVIILFVSAEEKGLLGSSYFVSDPVVPMSDIIANINVDMIGRSPDNSVGVIPSKNKDVTSMNKIAKRVNKRVNKGVKEPLRLRDDLDMYHHRSDHYNFVKNDIPAIFFFTGVHEDYHQPGDDWHKLRYDQMAGFYNFFRSFVMEVVNTTRPPAFTKGRNNG